ncbi:MAG: DUF433 domain-containing protein [Saprospiraceae bacterium]|nr:DUF433 domain-containing protein [Saprospiraceae bacterium]MCF8252396.1 DUF433 domain-containing protein [Saprospiraceae bacterium]MCF8282266.1 DUF433 domain-containing protein [Bacteroidales bacterium]MCF8313980.1 DUF433 domain-containing protein [Saprospiraceae bacterium]MCF8442726.1 DUF433 domain-containing protein [Saprospiraceae bacterium]
MNPLLERITLNPKVCNGKSTIRNMRFTVAQMLELLSASMTHEEILAEDPFIEGEDIRAYLLFAARMANAHSEIHHSV